MADGSLVDQAEPVLNSATRVAISRADRLLRSGHAGQRRQQREAIKRRESGEERLADIGRSYNVSGWTISRVPSGTA
ncbi:MAG: hypothetical protein ACREHF_12135 [Rhizomicrobium sp.]